MESPFNFSLNLIEIYHRLRDLVYTSKHPQALDHDSR